ncbi:coiled-coil domain-containing protein 180 [Gastrophryne carolinensis]
MALAGEIHVVPSGKVYRQIFDAEVQLVRSLGEARARVAQHGVSLDSGKIPLVHYEDTPSAGLLSHRQRQWVDSMPFDSYTENPLVHRQKPASAIRKTMESESEIAAREVRGLSDTIAPEKSNSGILQRITTNRQERHDKAASALQKELAIISKEMEILVLQAGRALQGNLSKSGERIEQLFQQCEEEKENNSLTMVVVNELWGKVTEESSYRRQCIRQADETLLELEQKRAAQIADVLKKYTTLMKEICYLMPSDVHRFIHKEAMMINQAILANHRAVAKLSLNLMEAELKREGSQRLRWQDLNKAWKSHEKERVVLQFRTFAQEMIDKVPDSIREETELLMSQCRPLHEKRLQLLRSVSDFIPPTCTKTAVTNWHKSAVALNKEIDSVATQFLDNLHRLESDDIQRCTMEAETCKKQFMAAKYVKGQLMSLDICSKGEAETIMTKELSPITKHFQIKHGKEQKLFMEVLSSVSKLMEAHSNKLYKYAKKAAHLWDVLEIGLSQQEKALKKKIDQCRKKHDVENQAKEANLDIILDSLRQGSTSEQLRATMGKALACLQDIKTGYNKCHQDQVKVVDSYPAMVLSQLLTYSSSVSKFFHVREVYGQNLATNSEESDAKIVTGRSKELRKESIIIKGQVTPSDKYNITPDHPIQSTDSTLPPLSEKGSPSAEDVEDTREEFSQVLASAGNEEAILNAPDHHEACVVEQTEDMKEDRIVEHFVTSRGNTYTVLSHKQKSQPVVDDTVTDHVFFTETVTEEECPIDVTLMMAPEQMIKELKNNIRLGFYEHLEDWFDKMMSNSYCIVLVKREEVKSELDLRCHLHEPRALRIEMDIHNVRAAELILHSERVDRHCEGVNEALNNLKGESALLIEKMKTETENFRKKIINMESIFLTANKSDKLVTLSNSLSSILDSHVSGIQTAMRNYRQHVEEMLGKLCDTNSDFIKSFRLFSEGGNFSPDEVETLRKRLHKASSTITSFEGSIMVDLEGLESLCLEQATEVVKKHEDKFISLTTDMIFLENIQKLLTNLQVKIKALVVASNSQSQQISSYLEQLQKKTDACANPNMDKEVVTVQDLYDFAKLIMKDVCRRSHYLSCLTEPSPVLPEVPLQGPIAAAARVDTPLRQDGKVTFGTPDSLLSPSRIGKLALDDAALDVIKNIMKTQQSNGESHQDQEDGSRQCNLAASRQTASQPLAPHPPSHSSSGSITKKKSDTGNGENIKFASPSVRKLVKPTRFDKKYQVFGEKKEESNDFKGLLTSLLWESNSNLLYLAEEFYKKKERRPIGRPDLLQETFEDCADMLVLKLQSYEKQALEYHNNCLLEFREQLLEFEKLLSEVPKLVIENRRREHLEAMKANIGHKQEIFGRDLERWNQTKEEMKTLLRPSLGHPDNCQTLEEICRKEESRQQEETEGIEGNAELLQELILEETQNFVQSLASLSEGVLLDLDETLTVDDVLPAKAEIPKKKLSTLIRLKQAGLPLEDTEYHPLIQRGSRVWPGINLQNFTNLKLGNTTASVTTAKTTLSHVSTVEARNSAYMKFLEDTEVILESIAVDRRQQNLAAQRWQEWWSQSVFKIKELYS